MAQQARLQTLGAELEQRAKRIEELEAERNMLRTEKDRHLSELLALRAVHSDDFSKISSLACMINNLCHSVDCEFRCQEPEHQP